MGEIADMMIEAMQNGGVTDDGVIIDTDTGEVLGIEADYNGERIDWRGRDRERMDGYVDRLRKQGFNVLRKSDYHIIVNGKLEVWSGKRGTSTKVIGSKRTIRTPNSERGVMLAVHNYFHYSNSKR